MRVTWKSRRRSAVMVVTKNVPVVAVLCGMAIGGLYPEGHAFTRANMGISASRGAEGHAFTHADDESQNECAFTRDLGFEFIAATGESEIRKSEPSAERERLTARLLWHA